MKVKSLRLCTADLVHKIWSRWMEYVFSVSTEMEDGAVVIPKDKVIKWKRQIHTDFYDLPLDETYSDINIAEEIIDCIRYYDK